MNEDEHSTEKAEDAQMPTSETPREANPESKTETNPSSQKVAEQPTPKTQEKDQAPDSSTEDLPSTDTESEQVAPKKKAKSTLEALLSEGEESDEVKIRKAKRSKNITVGICHILATFNNTRVSFSDMKGNTISWSSAGKCNFRGSRKSTSYAAQVVTQDAGRKAMAHGCKEVVVKVKGPGMGRDAAIRALQSLGFLITSIIEATPIPHNGCRPPKRRRV